MSLSVLPLSYCGNVHPTQDLNSLLQILETQTSRVQSLTGQPIAAGLWLADSLTKELSHPEQLSKLKEKLREHQLICYTLNAFPFGNFHQKRVKEQVYLPDWADRSRLEYTQRCAALLAELLPDGTEGSISTVPLGFKELCQRDQFQEECLDQLIELAWQLDQLHDETGRVIRLAIEPEPFCVLETTSETLQFFDKLRARAEQQGKLDVVNAHLGVCYDICHQAVEYEEIDRSIALLQQHEIRINKVHITCAVELKNPSANLAGRQFLSQFAEPRYLHQTFARLDGRILKQQDLSAEFALQPPSDWLSAESWRIHFHVPVHVDSLGPLGTTRQELRGGLEAIRLLEYAPHLEVETYTWNVLPGEEQPDILEGISRELRSSMELLQDLSVSASPVKLQHE